MTYYSVVAEIDISEELVDLTAVPDVTTELPDSVVRKTFTLGVRH